MRLAGFTGLDWNIPELPGFGLFLVLLHAALCIRTLLCTCKGVPKHTYVKTCRGQTEPAPGPAEAPGGLAPPVWVSDTQDAFQNPVLLQVWQMMVQLMSSCASWLLPYEQALSNWTRGLLQGFLECPIVMPQASTPRSPLPANCRFLGYLLFVSSHRLMIHLWKAMEPAACWRIMRECGMPLARKASTLKVKSISVRFTRVGNTAQRVGHWSFLYNEMPSYAWASPTSRT